MATTSAPMDVDQKAPTAPTIVLERKATVMAPLSTDLPPNPALYDENALSPLTGKPENASVVQPGVVVYDSELTNELPGKLIRGKTRNEGGYADVVEGTWVKSDGSEVAVAIKYLRNVHMSSSSSDEAKAVRIKMRLKREATVWEKVIHKNVLPLLGVRSDVEPCLISPWCKHGNLTEYLKEHPDLTIVEKLIFLRQAARGLFHLHTQDPPISHGDIKPTNVLITDDLEAAFCDFGLARVVQSLDSHTGLTTSGQGQGSRGFQAPELLSDESARNTTCSDVYAFGGLILAVTSGKPPFHEMKVIGKVVLAISMGKTPDPAAHAALPADDSLWTLMRRCWSFDPMERPSMEEVIVELDKEIAARSA